MTQDATYGPGSKFRVREALPSGFFDGLADPLIIRPGDGVSVLPDRSQTWPTFVLVSTPRGERGWVPERFLRREGNHARVQQSYNTKCLTPSVGEILELVEADVESGWLWCRNREGETGWFPILALEPPVSSPARHA